MGYLTAGLAVAAVASLVAQSAFARGAGGFNIVLLLIVAAIAIAELAAKAVARLRTPPVGQPAPAGSGTEGIHRAARSASMFAIIGIGAIVGFLSLLGGMATGGCSTNRCNTTVGIAWGALMLTQILIFLTALTGAARARYPGQLARATILGIIGPVLALLAFGSAADNATGPAQYGATAHYQATEPWPGHTALKATSG